MLQAFEIMRMVVPIIIVYFWKLVSACETLHDTFRPFLEPYIIFFLLQIQLIIVITLFGCKSMWNLIASPYNLAYSTLNFIIRFFDRFAVESYNLLLFSADLIERILTFSIKIAFFLVHLFEQYRKEFNNYTQKFLSFANFQLQQIIDNLNQMQNGAKGYSDLDSE